MYDNNKDRLINLNDTVYEISKEYPDIISILVQMGFKDIQKPGMLNTMGKFMTIPKGAAMKKIELSAIIKELESKGYYVIK
jgi:hypothetical protein